MQTFGRRLDRTGSPPTEFQDRPQRVDLAAVIESKLRARRLLECEVAPTTQPVDPERTVVVHRRRRDIQGMRALAVLMVVLFHAGGSWLPGGFVGVDVFFAISGFVITSSLVTELTAEHRIDLPRFYLRRARRLLPALAVVVTFVSIAGVLLDPIAATHMAGMTGVFATVFSANVYLWSLPTGYFDVSTQLNPLLHT